jgi:RNA polymerase sigma-70 factor (ECF subfamily)
MNTITDSTPGPAGGPPQPRPKPPSQRCHGAATAAAFEATCLPHRATLYRFAYGFTRNAADAEDLVQETLAAAYQYFDSFRPGGQAGAWLYAILRNRYLNHRRKREREGKTVSLTGMEETAVDDRRRGPEQVLMSKAETEAAWAAVYGLPSQYRDALLEYAGGDGGTDRVAYEEVARRAGLPVGTVRSRIHRGRERARRQLSAWQSGRGGPAALAPLPD